MVLLPVLLLGQTDTVLVKSDFGVGEGGLNRAIQLKVTAGTLSNTVFKLEAYGLYILNATVVVPAGKKLTIVGPVPGTTQLTAPPMICWTPTGGIDKTYNFNCFGDVSLKNIWLLYANTNTQGVGTQEGTNFEISTDTTDNLNVVDFDNVIIDYGNIASGGGAVTVSANHARLSFTNCYFRNLTDTHFRYYGRPLSFRFNTTGYHIDKVLFENCTVANSGYLMMQEGGEYADTVIFNHCTVLNTMMFTFESGWYRWLAITNSIFVNPYMFGHLGDAASTPNGGAVTLDSVKNFGFTVPYTDAQRHILFANNSYFIEKWLRDYMSPRGASNPAGGNKYSDTASFVNLPRPQPLMSTRTATFFNNKTAFPYISMKSVYDSTDPGFLIPPTNQIGIKSFLLRKWTDNSDTTWAFNPNSDVNQFWPMDEQLRYSNATLKTAGMAGYPLGDLYHWWNNLPTTYSGWLAQRTAEYQTINTLLATGVTAVEAQPTGALPTTFELSQNYPNPFNPLTQIKYALPQRGQVSLKVYNVLGMEVAMLFSGVQEAGNHDVSFEASHYSSGVYFYRLEAGPVTITKKMVLMK
jgi:hypothetical protein